MNLEQLINTASAYTDETFTASIGMSFANRAISKINTEVNLMLPYFDDDGATSNTEYTALPKDWLIGLIVPYLCYSIKKNDGSDTEAERYSQEFYETLVSFKERAGGVNPDGTSIISDDYKGDGFGGVYELDTSDAIDLGWFGIPNRGAF